MNSKNNVRKIKHKWRAGNRKSLISVTVAGVLIIVAVLFFALLSQRYIETRRKERAEYATDAVHSQLETKLESDFELLESMRDTGEIVNIGHLVSDIQFKDLTAIQSEHKLLQEGAGRYLAYNDGNLYLVVSDSEGNAVIGKIGSDRIREILNSAFNGSYGYALFDLKTGEFLINELGLEGGNYYDCMLDLKNAKAVEDLLENSKTQFGIELPEGRFYIAQEIRDFCGIMLVIPEALISGKVIDEIAALLPGVACAVIFVLAFIIWLIMMVKHGKHMSVVTEKRIQYWRQMAETVARRSNFAVFCLDNTGAQAGELLYYFNALPTSEDTELPVGIKTLDELETKLHVDVSEIGRLSNIANGMKDGDVVETEIHCDLSTGVQCLRFEMHCAGTETGRVFGCAYDVSDDERLRRTEISENEYLEDMRPRSEAIAHIDLSRNTWNLLYSRRQNFLTKLFERNGRSRPYDEDIRSILESSFQPEDFENFTNSMTSDALKTEFLNGRNEFSCDYRISVGNNAAYKWYRLVIRIWRDASDHDLNANIFIIDVNEQKKAEVERRERTDMLSRSLTAVGGIYFGLFYLDLNTGICFAAKPYRGQPDNQVRMPYRDMFSRYVSEFVHPDDQEAVMKAIDAWTIRKLMIGNSHLMQLRYRSKLGDGYYWSLLSIQAAQIENGAVTHAVITFQRLHNVDTTRCAVE